jgi:hypothetical protein
MRPLGCNFWRIFGLPCKQWSHSAWLNTSSAFTDAGESSWGFQCNWKGSITITDQWWPGPCNLDLGPTICCLVVCILSLGIHYMIDSMLTSSLFISQVSFSLQSELYVPSIHPQLVPCTFGCQSHQADAGWPCCGST